MQWLMDFYNESTGIILRYVAEATRPADAVVIGNKKLLADHPVAPRRRRLSLLEHARRVGGQDASGWVLYRIAKDGAPGSTGVAAPSAT